MLFHLQNQSNEAMLQDAFQDHQSHVSARAFDKSQNCEDAFRLSSTCVALCLFLLNDPVGKFITKFGVYSHWSC